MPKERPPMKTIAWLGPLVALGLGLQGFRTGRSGGAPAADVPTAPTAAADAPTAAWSDGATGDGAAATTDATADDATANSDPTAGLRGESVQCMAGGSGIVPCGPDAAPDCADSFYQAVAVVDLSNFRDAPVTGVTFERLEFRDDAGAVVATSRQVIDLTRLAAEPATAADGGAGTGCAPCPPVAPVDWSLLGATGEPFDGSLPPGATRLRVHVFLDHPPRAEHARFRLTLLVGGEPLIVEGELSPYSWPTG
jgi:hypothetical protein